MLLRGWVNRSEEGAGKPAWKSRAAGDLGAEILLQSAASREGSAWRLCAVAHPGQSCVQEGNQPQGGLEGGHVHG